MANAPLFRRITQGPRINLPKQFLDELDWRVNDQVSIEILPVEKTNKIVITNESQKYRMPLKERLNSINTSETRSIDPNDSRRQQE